LDLEAELDRLYAADLDAFVTERARLVRELRGEGRKAEAAAVQERRKPSLPAWVVNQLARRHRKDIDLLLDAGHRLAGAQEALLGGDAAAFDEARSREQASLRRLRHAAEGILGERASPAMLERVVSTLRAASLSPDARAELARGRLTGEVSPPGFEMFAAGAPTRPAKARRAPPSERSSRSGATKSAGRREAVTRAEGEVRRAKEQHAALAGQLREAERAVRAARKSLASAERDADRLRAEERTAAAAVDAARAKLDAARHPLS
jgi:hypothetical protein